MSEYENGSDIEYMAHLRGGGDLRSTFLSHVGEVFAEFGTDHFKLNIYHPYLVQTDHHSIYSLLI